MAGGSGESPADPEPAVGRGGGRRVLRTLGIDPSSRGPARPGPPASAGVGNSACGGFFRAQSRETVALRWPPVQREPGVLAVTACGWVSSLEAGGSLLGLHKKLVGLHFFSFPCSRTAGKAVVTLPRNDVKNIPREGFRCGGCAVPHGVSANKPVGSLLGQEWH